MSRRLQSLLWRYGCGLVSGDRLERALEERCRQLLDRRFEHAATRAEGAWTAKPTLGLRHEFESTIGLARAHIRAREFRRAHRTLRRAETALEGMLRLLEASGRLVDLRERWRLLTVELGLEAFSHYSTLRAMEGMLRVGDRCLSRGEPAKAEAALRLAKARFEALLSSEAEKRGQGEGRDEEGGAPPGSLEARLRRLRAEGEPIVVQCIERLLDQGFSEVGSRFLEDWEMSLPESRESTEASPETQRFEELIHRSQDLSVHLNRLAPAQDQLPKTDRGESS